MTVDAILCSDLHLTSRKPPCRPDNMLDAAIRKIKWINELKNKHGCPVFCAGDIFDRWKQDSPLISIANDILKGWICIPGNHDLPNQSRNLVNKSAYGVMNIDTNKDFFTYKDAFGQCIFKHPTVYPENTSYIIILAHKFIYKNTPPFPGADSYGYSAVDFIDFVSSTFVDNFRLILTGDNHASFTYKKGNTLLVNPGSLLRMTTAQKDHRPSVYLWNAEANEVERAYIPLECEIITNEEQAKGTTFTDGLNTNMNVVEDPKEQVLEAISNINNEGVKRWIKWALTQI